ncbi:MAG: TraB/GumN family protein [Muricauda sp.]|nr:TraB/GumN family protein [Allomuricauda sp.]MBA4745994.1 TraB/GumN family protein [Allomuricauda sp.]
MKRIWIGMVLIVGLLHPLRAQEFGTLLFEVKHPNSDKVSYLFGTHHAFSKSFFDTLSVAKTKLLTAETVVLESLDIPGKNSEDIINVRPKRTSWKSYLDKDDLAYVRNLLSKSPVDFEKMLPAELHATLYRIYNIKKCKTRSDVDPDLSLDGYVGALAKTNGKALIGLESVAEQLDIMAKDLAGMPRRIHKRRLAAIVYRLRNETATVNCEEVNVYKNQQFDFQLEADCKNAVMLTDRNSRWMETLPELLLRKNCFVAVGLSHLRFKCGLIAQLREKGFLVTVLPSIQS